MDDLILKILQSLIGLALLAWIIGVTYILHIQLDLNRRAQTMFNLLGRQVFGELPDHVEDQDK